MSEIDFTAALARLLTDGRLRDAFAVDPVATLDSLGVPATEQDAFRQLNPADLEFQARVLLHKRFEQIRSWLPSVCRRLDDAAWPMFEKFARTRPPGNATSEALEFACSTGADRNCSELHRLRFITGSQRWSLAGVPDLPIRGRSRRGLQLLLRRGEQWRELAIYFGL